MQYGWVSTAADRAQIKYNFHVNGDMWLTMNNPIQITDKTFRFVGYKTSIINFLMEHPHHAIAGADPRPVFIKGGHEMDEPWEAVVGAVGKGVAGLIKAPTDTWELAFSVKDAVEMAFDHAWEKGNELDAKHGKVKSSAFTAFLDRRFNKRLIIDLQSYVPGNDDSWKELGKKVTFVQLAAAISQKF